MTDGLASIITSLEQQKAAIDKALSALREVDGLKAPVTTVKQEGLASKGKKRSAAVRKRMQEAQRARWAKIKGEAGPAPAPEALKAKRKISPEGMKRIIAATKKRWALKRAADKAAVKKTVKKAAKKKAAAGATDVVPF